MKLLILTKEEQRTLREMGIFHGHVRTRMRAQGILRLSHGLTLQQTADEFGVHLNSVEHWRQQWNRFGLSGLYEGRHTGRPLKWTAPQQEALRELAQAEGGTAGALLRQMEQRYEQKQISETTLKRYLKQMNFRYKRYRYSLKKKRNEEAFESAQQVITSLVQLAHEGECELIYFDESGFSPNPPVQYGWTRMGQSRCMTPESHRQRVNVLGALHHGGELVWTTLQRATVREDVIGFFDQLADLPHSAPRIVILDNAPIHKGDLMEEKRREWEKKALYLYYLPPYSPELNRIEILWKQAKYFWRRFDSIKGAELLDAIQSLMKGFGTKFTINFA